MGDVASRSEARKRAEQIIQQFETRIGKTYFPNVVRADVADGLRLRIRDPRTIDQASANLCGPAALVYSWIDNEPDKYAQFAVDLYEKGEATVHKWTVKPTKRFRENDIKSDLHPVDWIVLGSIRNEEDGLFRFDSPDDGFSAITMPGDMVRWFKKLGYTDVRDETNTFLFRKGERNLREASRLFGEGYEVCLLLHAKALKNLAAGAKRKPGGPTPNHWVVLDGSVQFLGDDVRVLTYTWGNNYVIQLPKDEFFDYYWGYVAARD